MLRQFVADRDEPCPACRYNLRNLQTHCCPECGLPLTLRVALSEPAWGTYLASIIGASLGLGFCGLLLTFIAVRFVVGASIGAGLVYYVPLFAGTAISGGIILWLVRRRRVFIRLSPDARLPFAGACWLVGVGFPVWFLLWAS